MDSNIIRDALVAMLIVGIALGLLIAGAIWLLVVLL